MDASAKRRDTAGAPASRRRRTWPGPAEIHLWRSSLDLGPAVLADLSRTLSDDETERARRFRFERDRERFVAARGLLRRLLASYLGTGPPRLDFVTGAHGKPRLAGEPPPSLRFSVSHTADLALYAVASGREVGVDAERIRPDLDVDAVARRFFSINERAALAALPPERRVRASFDCWTRKEAYLKGLGLGLAVPLAGFDVTVEHGQPVRVSESGSDVHRWFLAEVDVGVGYVGAVAFEREGEEHPILVGPFDPQDALDGT
jgi:4'-phosphopantetheinyl transferase